jgi:GTPase SAR1 family protein
MQFASNPQIDLAYQYVRNTNKNIFLTGRAGTGKTTFLHTIKTEGLKRMVIVAPTGVAAINAGGMTIHSFFQLPFGLWLPDTSRQETNQRKFSSEKIRMIKSIDLLVIDEISMVRADLLDSMDEVLRKFKNPTKPFGGVQLLMIGDLHQLPPVVKNEEWDLLKKYYSTPYFFGSLALQKTEPVTIELKHIYRQSDSTFIDLLNKVRDNKIDQSVLEILNSRYIADFQPSEEEPYITLTAHNATAAEINIEKLAALKTKSQTFKASIEGSFPAFSFPTDEDLELKLGAQVMFVKNDFGAEKRFYNGKIGKITAIADDEITVACPNESETIAVTRMDWENIKYSLEEKTKEVKEEVVGAFTQFPLKLAWAITIHKSQGLTFERAIIDAQAAFAHGQVYVALSRCRSFEGIVLRSRIQNSSVKTDQVVKSYSDHAEKNAPDAQHLIQSKGLYQEALIEELFTFRGLKRLFEITSRVFDENSNTLGALSNNHLQQLAHDANEKLVTIGAKFVPQLRTYFGQGSLAEENQELQERIKKAAAYFIEHLNALETDLRKLTINTDNKAVRKTASEQIGKLKKEAFVKLSAFQACANGFSAEVYMRAMTNSELDFMAAQTVSQAQNIRAPLDVKHPELYSQLAQWRRDTAEVFEIEAYQVLPNKSLQQLVDYLPTDKHQLGRINGIGKVKLEQFGNEILTLIEQYCTKYQLPSNLMSHKEIPEKIQKEDTKRITFDLYKAGKTVAEIATERGFVQTTIEGHLAHFVGIGALDIFEIMPRKKVELIEAYFLTHAKATSAEAKLHLPDDCTYTDIKMVTNYMQANANIEPE